MNRQQLLDLQLKNFLREQEWIDTLASHPAINSLDYLQPQALRNSPL